MLMDVIRMEKRRSFGLFMTEIKQCADIVMGCALVFTEPALYFDFMLQSNQPLYSYIFFSLRKKLRIDFFIFWLRRGWSCDPVWHNWAGQQGESRAGASLILSLCSI